MKKVALGAAALVAGTLLSVPGTATAAVPARTPRAAQAVPAAASAAGNPRILLGSKGAAVVKLQKRLKVLHYDPGKADGKYGSTTRAAVWAFQKVNGLKPGKSGVVGAKTWAALAEPKVWKAIAPKAKRKADRVEISISRQLIAVYRRNKVILVTHTSTGSGRYEDGAVSRTPRGWFKVQRKIRGVRVAKLGTLYNPIYFHNGYAMHGSPNVPLYPDSHGCARLPFGTDLLMFKLVPVGRQVYVK